MGNKVDTTKAIRDPQHIAETTVAALGASSVAKGPFNGQTYWVRICGSGNFHYTVGTSPVATANSAYLASGVVEIVAITPGDKIAVIQDGSSTGNVTFTEMEQG